jgi:predicted AAA+ superfamily ATPase
MITPEQMESVCRDWSYWDKAVPRTVARTEVLLPQTLDPALPIVVQGVRRCGKSTFLAQMLKKYEIPRESALFLNFEDPRLPENCDHEFLDACLQFFRKKIGQSKKLYFFFDEIQGVKNWERWLNAQIERPSRNLFFLTGSNASLLSGELSTALTGRHWKCELFPFNFSEYQKLTHEKNFEDFLQRGGFPKPLQVPDSRLLLQQYFKDIVERDIREKVKARSSLQLSRMVKAVFEAVGSETSLRRLSAVADVAVETVSSYLDACEQAYLIFSVPFFGYSQSKTLQRNKKYYAIDSGLRHSVLLSRAADIGKDFENYVFLQLKKKYNDVFYWKGKREVDFVVQGEKGPIPFQVSTEAQPLERHLEGWTEFYKEFPHSEEGVFISPKNVSKL